MLKLSVIVILSSFIFVVGAFGELDLRIVGGQNADIADYPYQLSLIYADLGHFCGAILISPNWALTAAHCTNDIDAANISVHAGSSVRDSDDGVVVEVSKVIQHPDFIHATDDSDISLLQLSSNIPATNAVPIGIASTSPESGEMGIVSGWGVTSENDQGMGSDVLQVLEIPIISHEVCKIVYATDGILITDNMFCAGVLWEGGEDACSGDSGGPMVVGGVVSGIVSWGVGCAEPTHPGVYTDISRFRNWIKQHSGI